MDNSKCFADVIGDPQALNDFLKHAQILADQENNRATMQHPGQPRSNADALAAIVAKATDGQMMMESNEASMNDHTSTPISLNYGNSPMNMPNYSNSKMTSVSQRNNQQSAQNFNFMTSQGQIINAPLNTLAISLNNHVSQSNTPVANSSTNFSSSPRRDQQSLSNHTNYGSIPTNDVSSLANKTYALKAQTKQPTKHIPNILSKGTPSSSNATANQAILLPAYVNGKYIIVNNQGQTTQAVSMAQNISQGTQQVLTQDMLQNTGQQNQQVLLLPSNFQQLVSQNNAMQKQAGLMPNRNVNSPRQQLPAQSIASTQQLARQSPKVQRQIQQKTKTQGTVLPRQQSPGTKGISPPVQQSLQAQGFQSNQQLTRNVGQVPISSSLYQSPQKTPDGVKIVRPAVQPRGILPKPGSQAAGVASPLPETKADPKPTTAKLSHFPIAQPQLQNLQNLVAQQDVAGQYLQASQQGNKLPASTPKVDQSGSNLGSQQQRVNMPLGSAFASTPGKTNAPLQAGSNIALQQLLQLSQAAAQPTAEASKSTSESDSVAQNTTLAAQQQQLQNRVRATTHQQLLQQALAGNQKAQVLLQAAKQQPGINSDPNAASNRASIIEKNLQTILSRQNASKQAAIQKSQSDSTPNAQQQTTNNLTAKINFQDGQNQPLQLFMPKQLTSSQLMELQQKLLAGKIMQKMQDVQPKIASKSDGATSAANLISVQNPTGISLAGNTALTLRQVPGTGNSGPSYQFVATGTEGSGNQVVLPISTQGMQVLLKTNPTLAQSMASGTGKAQNLIVVPGKNQPQKPNLPVLQVNNTNVSKASGTGGTTVQGVRIQNAAAPNIVIKQMDASSSKVLSEQQKVIQGKKIQQLLLQLTPAQRNLLLKKQQELVSKGQTMPLAKLICQVRQEKVTGNMKAPVLKDVKPVKRPAPVEVKTEETSEMKVARMLKHCLSADQTRTLEPAYNVPFASTDDAVSRLLPYHIHHEPIPPDIEWQKAEAVFSIVSKQLIARKEKLFDKYHSLLYDESQHEIPSSEVVMLERIFLADEKARLAKDREDAKLGKLKLFAEDSTTAEDVDKDNSEDSSVKNHKHLNIKIQSSMLDIGEDTVDIEREEELNDDDEEEDENMEEADEEGEDEDDDDGDDEEEDTAEYVDIDDDVEDDAGEEEPGDDGEDAEDREVSNVDNDEQMESEEEGEEEEEEDEEDEEEYESNNIDISQVLNRHPNDNDLSDIVEIDDFDRTNEQNMSEELSEATFNLMADLENDMNEEYYD